MEPLYEKSDPSLDGLPSDWHAVDTETTLFNNEKYSADGKTRLSPPITGMRLILGSIASRGKVSVWYKNDLISEVRRLLLTNQHLVFHHAAFDIIVLCEKDPSLKKHFIRACRENRIHDTKILEPLCRMAAGTHKDGTLLKETSLKALARRYAGLELEKGQERITFGAFILSPPDPHRHLSHLQYAAMDAVATYRVCSSLYRKAQQLAHPPECHYPAYPHAELSFGPLSERNVVMGSIAISYWQRFPVTVDLARVNRAIRTSERTMNRLVDAMCTWGAELTEIRKRKAGPVSVQVVRPWALRRRDGSTHLSHKVLRLVLEIYAADHEISAERVTSGDVTLEHDFWREHISPAPPALLANPSAASTVEEQLSVWMSYQKLRMAHARYLLPLSASADHYPSYFAIGALTSRTSAKKFPIHQVPKRSNSLRGLFKAKDGEVLVESDLVAAELSAMAAVYHELFGDSALGRAINAGEDVHIACARRIWPDFDSQDPATQKDLRSAAKVANLGLVGGLGPTTFSKFARGYGLTYSVDQARAFRNQVLAADPELSQWITARRDDEALLRLAARNLQMSVAQLVTHLGAWRDKESNLIHHGLAIARLRKWARRDPSAPKIPTPIGFKRASDLLCEPSRTLTGIVRGSSTFCQAKNFPMQGLIADVLRVALFNLWAEHNSTSPWRVYTHVHDSICLTVKDEPSATREASLTLQQAFSDSLAEILPEIPGAAAEVGPPTKYWGQCSGIFEEIESEPPSPC